MEKGLCFLVSALLVAGVSYAETKTWNGGASGSWNTGTNWDPDGVPLATDDVIVGSGVSVTDGQREFTNLQVGSGATVTFVEDLGAANVIDNAGTINRAGVWRLNGATITMAATSHFGSGITFLDTNGSTINFVDGATFENTAMSFEHKGVNTFGYKLSASGFTTLVCGFVRSGNSAVWADATYKIDISDYEISNGDTIVLADYSGSTMPAPFNPTVNIIAGSSGLSATLSYNDTTYQLILTLDYGTLIWDGEGGDNQWTTAANWRPNIVPTSADDAFVGAGASVINGQREFANLEIASGAAVTFVEDLTGGNTIDNFGTLNCAGVWRLNSATIGMAATSSFGSGITFLDTNGATINFVDGAAFDNTAMPFEHKGINTFGYKLSATGFTTLIAGFVRSGNSATWADATYNIDISDYDLANGATVTLADYSGSTMPAPFNPTVNIETGSSDLRATLDYDDTLYKLILNIKPPAGTVFIIK